MNKRKLEKTRMRLLRKSVWTDEEERYLINITQRLSRALGRIPFKELPLEQQMQEARRIMDELKLK